MQVVGCLVEAVSPHRATTSGQRERDHSQLEIPVEGARKSRLQHQEEYKRGYRTSTGSTDNKLMRSIYYGDFEIYQLGSALAYSASEIANYVGFPSSRQMTIGLRSQKKY